MQGKSDILPTIMDNNVICYLRDKKRPMFDAWKEKFSKHTTRIQISSGEFLEGALNVDAFVLPTNCSGIYMNGGIENAIAKQFGKQIQETLQGIIKTKHDGEILVGQAVLVPIQDSPDKYVIAAPTMRIPMDVSKTPNAYLSFRAVLLAVHQHNRTSGKDPIKTVLVSGLATGGGAMPEKRCAAQMLEAYETFVMKARPSRLAPKSIDDVKRDHKRMCGEDE